MKRIAVIGASLLLAGCTALHEASEVLHVGVSTSFPPDYRVYARAPLWLGVELSSIDSITSFGSDFGESCVWTDTGAGLVVFGGTRRTASGAGRPYVDELHLLASVPLTDTRAPFVVPTRIEAGVHVALVGVSVGVDPVQLVDALTALAGYDLLGDDPSAPGASPTEPGAARTPI